jgi:DNA-binding transcriptional ArsR family regulator
VKLDIILVRKVLLAVEELDDGADEDINLELDGYSHRAVNYHCRLLAEAGLIETIEVPDSDPGEPLHYLPTRLTWSGHQFLASVHDEGVWKEVRGRLAKVGGAAVLEVVKAVAVEVSKSFLHLQ